MIRQSKRNTTINIITSPNINLEKTKFKNFIPSITENILKIKIKKKITELNEAEIKSLYILIIVFIDKEKEKGNIPEQAHIKITYKQNIQISDYINMFKIINKPLLHDFTEFFKKRIKEIFDKQNTNTKMNIDDYITQTEHISQEIEIEMVFVINTNKNEILEK
jgi:hypothetical protein